MNVSVIIPVLNEYCALKKLIPSLIAHSGHNQFDVILCDAGSSDLSASYIHQLISKNTSSISFNWVTSELGRAKQMNAGAQQARYEHLLFLHADTQLPKDWPSLIMDKQWGRFDVCLTGRHPMLRVVEAMMNWRSCVTQVVTGDQAIFIQKKLFHQVGGYPDIPLMEDIAISKLLRKKMPISCIKIPLTTSSRRWEKQGVFKTIILMWYLRLAYFCGISPIQLAKQYYPNYQVKRSESLIQVFTKLPILGFVKTRLIPHLGEHTATEIHRYLLRHTLDVVAQSKIENELWVAQEKSYQLAQDDEFLNVQTMLQHGDNLGERMALAIEHGLKTHRKVVLIGTDCLDLTPTHLKQSLAALDNVDVVLTPVDDGGFISIAFRVFDRQIFEQVTWGSSSALADVLKNIEKLSLHYELLESVRDIDTFEDVAQYPELINLNQ